MHGSVVMMIKIQRKYLDRILQTAVFVKIYKNNGILVLITLQNLVRDQL